MTRLTLIVIAALMVVGGCSQTSESGTAAKAEKPVIKTEEGKGQPTTSNNELSLNPNRGDAAKAGAALGGK